MQTSEARRCTNSDMQNMFKDKGVKTIDKQVVIEPKFANPSIHIVDVNMAITRSKVTKEQMFNDREPINKKYVSNQEEE